MKPIFLGLGSNVGNRLRHLREAAEAIGKLSRTSVIRSSAVYETEPVGLREQPAFLNAVLEIESELSPADLFRNLKTIETRLGRTQTAKWGPREIDIDILYYGGLVLEAENLRIPHGEISNRRFVLKPLADIAPQFRDPRDVRTVAELLSRCGDTSNVKETEWKNLISFQEH